MDLVKDSRIQVKLIAIFAWHVYMVSTEGNTQDQKTFSRLVKYIPKIIKSRFEDISGNDLFRINDALGQYTDRDKQLDSIYNSASVELHKRIKKQYANQT